MIQSSSVRTAVVAVSFVLSLSSFASARQAVSGSAAVSETFTIQAIDAANRLVTVKDSDGFVETVEAGPEVKRFSELKVGDKIVVRYYESVLAAVRPVGATAPTATGDPTLVRNKTKRPSGTLSQQLTATVTVTAVDLKVPSLSVKTENGETLSFKVEDKANIEKLKAGDKVDISYTRALAVHVESPKK